VVVTSYIYIYIYTYIHNQEAAVLASETPSEKKARLALEKVKALKISKGHQDMVKLAKMIMSKVGPVIVPLTALLAKDEMPMVPVVVKQPLELSLQRFSEYEENAKEVISSEGIVSTMVDDLKDFFGMAKPEAKH
jgi:hypothetical protein